MIEVRHLTKRYADFTAVDDLSLTVERGEVYGFLGPNGAGKTTTIRILAGLSLPTSGTVSVGGHDVVTDGLAAKAIGGYVPDRPYLYEKLTGRELLQFVANLYGREWRDCEARALELLRWFDVAEWVDARIESLSHGMKQKVVIASALVHDPEVLIVDEPMVGLDAFAQKQVRLLIRRLAREGKTIFLTTHTLSVAEAVCDRIAILSHGRIVASGTAAEIKETAGRSGSALEDVFLQLTYGEEGELP
ncbi:MAG TPA: ABC transporter ATP-binding protein [Thermoanaerobaculia bacterium]|nr:ABC transporter ATP-binding protein [Thermoanaerobaculia bacterium]